MSTVVFTANKAIKKRHRVIRDDEDEGPAVAVPIVEEVTTGDEDYENMALIQAFQEAIDREDAALQAGSVVIPPIMTPILQTSDATGEEPTGEDIDLHGLVDEEAGVPPPKRPKFAELVPTFSRAAQHVRRPIVATKDLVVTPGQFLFRNIDNDLKQVYLDAVKSHARDDRLRIDEGPHIYYLKVPPMNNEIAMTVSVTGLIGCYFPPFPDRAAAFAVAKSDRYLTDDEFKDLRLNKPTTDLRERATNILGLWEDVKNAGTAMHKLLEFRCGGADKFNSLLELAQYEERFAVEMKQFDYYSLQLNFPPGTSGTATDLELRRPADYFVPYRIEQKIFDEVLELAGGIDMQWVRLSDRHSARPDIKLIDWKRSAKVHKTSKWTAKCYGNVGTYLKATTLNKYKLQLCMYAELLEKHYNVTVTEMEIVAFHPLFRFDESLPDAGVERTALTTQDMSICRFCVKGILSDWINYIYDKNRRRIPERTVETFRTEIKSRTPTSKRGANH